MKDLLRVDIGHLFSDTSAADLVQPSALPGLHARSAAGFEEVRASLADGSSPLTRFREAQRGLPAMKELAASLRTRYENVVLVGIGGSALGFRTIMRFLGGPFRNARARRQGLPRMYIADNIDPVLGSGLSELLDFRKTALICVTKSGTTPETAANFMHFYEEYRQVGGVPEDVIVICGPGDNAANRIAAHERFTVVHIPDDLPGRYSALSASGVLPAEVIGIDTAELLAGGAALHQAILDTPLEQNAVFALGVCLDELTRKGKNIHVLFSYGSPLYEFGLWFTQLWSESLGKRLDVHGNVVNRGTTPLPALGATDQHSLLQLFKEGPSDKAFGFVSVDDLQPDVMLGNQFPEEPDYSYLAGHTMGEQLRVERLATEVTLVNAGRPCYHIALPAVSPQALGALFQFMEALVVFVAKLWQVDPFDQPGVEESKEIMYAVMGREGYTDQRAAREQALSAFEGTRRWLKL